MRLTPIVLLASLGLLGCGGGGGTGREAAKTDRPAETSRAPAPPGEEPLETEILEEESVATLPEARRPATPPPSPRRPCNWAKAWDDPAQPDPLLAGVGGVPSPARVESAPIQIPVKEPLPAGEIVVELVILPDGSVGEAAVVRTTTPPWPEAEAAVLEAVRRFRYEPPRFDGTPVAVCTTVSVQP